MRLSINTDGQMMNLCTTQWNHAEAKRQVLVLQALQVPPVMELKADTKDKIVRHTGSQNASSACIVVVHIHVGVCACVLMRLYMRGCARAPLSTHILFIFIYYSYIFIFHSSHCERKRAHQVMQEDVPCPLT